QMSSFLRKSFQLSPSGGGGDILGTIWQGQQAQTAFDDNKKDKNEKKAGDDDDRRLHSIHLSSNNNNNALRVVFRNLTPLPLLLCWVSFDGTLHHFYRLEPWEISNTAAMETTLQLSSSSSSNNKKNPNAEDDFLVSLSSNDHLERTHAGHAFCLIHADTEELLQQIRRDKALPSQQTTTNQLSSSAGMMIVGGYRPKVLPATKKRTGNDTQIQLVEISHNGREEEHPSSRQWHGSAKEAIDCRSMLRPCFGGLNLRKRKFDHDDNDDEDGDTQQSSFLRFNPRGWRLKAQWRKLDTAPLDTSNKVYDETLIGGWPCCVEPGWSAGDPELEQMMSTDIEYASKCLPPHAREYLKQNCKIWINKSLSWGPKSCPVKGRGCCYHPDRKWLIENGLSGDKAHCVEMNSAPYYKSSRNHWGTGGVILHELSHAYHHSMLSDGYKNCDIKDCYEQAMKEGLYDKVRVHGPQGPTAKAYACSNPMEYWAELSAAFLGGLDKKQEYNKWYPFNRQQIEEHDPRAFTLLSTLWKAGASTKK
ncbi:MAG: hypothetical protein SGILL_009241, partial [Bacillariaceae sp.]